MAANPQCCTSKLISDGAAFLDHRLIVRCALGQTKTATRAEINSVAEHPAINHPRAARTERCELDVDHSSDDREGGEEQQEKDRRMNNEIDKSQHQTGREGQEPRIELALVLSIAPVPEIHPSNAAHDPKGPEPHPCERRQSGYLHGRGVTMAPPNESRLSGAA